MTIKEKFKSGKRVRIKSSVSLSSYNMWLKLKDYYPSLKRPCHLKSDGILEVLDIIFQKYILVKTLDDDFAISVFDSKDLEILN